MIRDKEITNEIKFLEKIEKETIIKLAKLQETNPVNSSLRAVRHGGGYQYFIRERGTRKNGKYVKKKEQDKVIRMAQAEYYEKLIRIVRENIDCLSEFKTSRVGDIFEFALKQMTPGKRILVEQLYISDQEYINKWKNQEYEHLYFKENCPNYYTRGELRVRSKSEVIIADILDDMAIPFLYEKPLNLRSTKLHPDFTLLNIKERKEVYWEHFGMMDDLEYRNNAFLKIREYESSGLFQNDSLIWTFETEKYPLNIKDLRAMIKVLKSKLGYE